MERLGQAILQLRLDRGWTQQELAARAGPSVETISNIERGAVAPKRLTLHKLLRALDAEPRKFKAYLSGVTDDLETVKRPVRLDLSSSTIAFYVQAITRELTESATASGLPVSIRTELKRPARSVPEFPIGVAASRRVEKVTGDHAEAFRMVDTEDLRVFTAPVDGDCMEPKWLDGEIAVFSYDAFEREGILAGRSYYLAFTDGTSTFKRVFTDPDEPDVYVLRCWNDARYPMARRVHYSEVVRIARAVSKVVVPVEE